MSTIDWRGVMPAITTPFHPDLSIDHASLASLTRLMIERGSTGVVTPGSLGEGSTLSREEKVAVWRTCVGAAGGVGGGGGGMPVIAAIASASTAEAVASAREAEAAGCRGLMVLPPYVHSGDAREAEAHVSAVVRATGLSCMLYNNPIAYGTDFVPERVAALARTLPNLHAVKESSGDVRRITAIRALAGDRLAVFVGVDDLIVEGVAAGAVGWIAGLVNAFPDESVRLFRAATEGGPAACRGLYEWFLPLLRLDVVPKFVQLIKLAQQEVGTGNERVRPPRLTLEGDEREAALRVIRDAVRTRPGG